MDVMKSADGSSVAAVTCTTGIFVIAAKLWFYSYSQ